MIQLMIIYSAGKYRLCQYQYEKLSYTCTESINNNNNKALLYRIGDCRGIRNAVTSMRSKRR